MRELKIYAGEKRSYASKILRTSISDGSGNANAIKTHAARRVLILIMFGSRFRFFKEKSGMEYRRVGAFFSHFGRMKTAKLKENKARKSTHTACWAFGTEFA